MRLPTDAKGKARRQDGGDQVLPAAADLFVHDLPGLQLNSSSSSSKPPSLYAGNLPSVPSTSKSDAHLYFLLATNRHIPRRQRLLLWFNGGPGCSSFDGAMIEIGPVRVNQDMTVSVVEGTAWNEYANVLFIDQPAGTGYSYVNQHDDARELTQAAAQVVTFLSNFYKVFPEYSSMDTYLAGESYAGQWIPYIADAILASTVVNTPLKGLLIGNGWISPRHQYPAYLDYLVERDIVKKGSSQYNAIRGSVDACEAEFKRRDNSGQGDRGTVLIGVCENILGAVTANTVKDGKCINLYDTTEYFPCGSTWPHELNWVTPYLQKEEVVRALHGEGSLPRKWVQCSGLVGAHFWTLNSRPSVVLLPKLLEQIPILLFAGDRDVMCAGTGIRAMIDDLEWNGATGWNGSEAVEWKVDGAAAGLWRTARNLTYVDVYDSSHMVPLDVPLAAHDMALRFMDVDTINAAGGAARVPSRVGSETEALVGATHPNGTALQPLDDASDKAIEAAKSVTEDGFDKQHELLYGPRRTAFLFFVLIFFGFVIWAFFNLRAARRRNRYSRLKGKSRAAIQLEESTEDERAHAADLEAGHPYTMSGFEESLAKEHIFDVGQEDDDDDDDDDESDRAKRDEVRDEDLIGEDDDAKTVTTVSSSEKPFEAGDLGYGESTMERIASVA